MKTNFTVKTGISFKIGRMGGGGWGRWGRGGSTKSGHMRTYADWG